MSAGKTKTAAELAGSVLLRCKLAELRRDELSDLSHDLQEQMAVHGPEAVRAAFPGEDPEELLKAIRHESSRQTLSGLRGGALGGVAGGVGGALLSALTRGKEHALAGGLLGVVPGSLGGYVLGR
jgi:hypothetical protein